MAFWRAGFSVQPHCLYGHRSGRPLVYFLPVPQERHYRRRINKTLQGLPCRDFPSGGLNQITPEPAEVDVVILTDERSALLAANILVLELELMSIS